MTRADRLKSHYESLARAIGFTRVADAKAAPVVALQAALVGTLAARADKLQGLLIEDEWGLEWLLLIAVIVLYVLSLGVAVFLAIRVYMPVSPRTGRSFIYFEDIAAKDFEAFEAGARAARSATIEHQLLDQVHRVSTIASLKMKWVRQALWSTVASGGLWLVLLAWGSVQ